MTCNIHYRSEVVLHCLALWLCDTRISQWGGVLVKLRIYLGSAPRRAGRVCGALVAIT